MKLERMVEDFRAALGWPYASPGGTGRDCSRCGIDCSGMFVRAYRLQGETIAHGSNRIWRRYLSDKGVITSPELLEVGMAVFRHRAKDTAKYPDGEGDFYHIGLVVGVSPVRIVHASTNGNVVREDIGAEGWTHWGWLAAVEKTAGVKGCVTAAKGETVNIRRAPGGAVQDRLAIGSEVEILRQADGWTRVRYTVERTGYVMDDYINRMDLEKKPE